jgi:hypothetical protein
MSLAPLRKPPMQEHSRIYEMARLCYLDIRYLWYFLSLILGQFQFDFLGRLEEELHFVIIPNTISTTKKCKSLLEEK